MSRSMLLLGTGNTTRSIMAEAYINHVARGRWRAHSAGLVPADEVDPSALRGKVASWWVPDSVQPSAGSATLP